MIQHVPVAVRPARIRARYGAIIEAGSSRVPGVPLPVPSKVGPLKALASGATRSRGDVVQSFRMPRDGTRRRSHPRMRTISSTFRNTDFDTDARRDHGEYSSPTIRPELLDTLASERSATRTRRCGRSSRVIRRRARPASREDHSTGSRAGCAQRDLAEGNGGTFAGVPASKSIARRTGNG